MIIVLNSFDHFIVTNGGVHRGIMRSLRAMRRKQTTAEKLWWRAYFKGVVNSNKAAAKAQKELKLQNKVNKLS